MIIGGNKKSQISTQNWLKLGKRKRYNLYTCTK